MGDANLPSRHRGLVAEFAREPALQPMVKQPAPRPTRETASPASARTMNLSGRDLMGQDLSGADLRGANLAHARLRETSLRGAALDGAQLNGADLRSADMSWSGLRRANLSGADCSGADLTRADLRGAVLLSARLSGADLSGADARDTLASCAELRGVRLCGADMRWSRLDRAVLRGADASGAWFDGATLLRADLSLVRLSATTRLHHSFLSDCRLFGTPLSRMHIDEGIGEECHDLALAARTYRRLAWLFACQLRAADAGWARSRSARMQAASHRPDLAPRYHARPCSALGRWAYPAGQCARWTGGAGFWLVTAALARLRGGRDDANRAFAFGVGQD